MSDGFFDRWSRRKQQARESAAPVVAPAEVPPETPPTVVIDAPSPATPVVASDAPPPPTLADTTALTIDSDFKPFMAKGVAPEVKNAAFKKLFADPHFNVMDRMDIYIDDYSIPSPLPESVLRQMASAKFLKLFDEEPEAPEARDEAASPMPGETPQDDAPPAVAQSEPSPSPLVADAQPASQPTDDPNADLRLQPDDAARADDARRRTG
ncbi:DUF3306 domain-containing protein [Variovorax arabinosiphilus]|uniref:DUF3306 domain-containing protein n=1 Tax=Variovorax arabinosiphilus TaxID=3053498 RepID=UPI002574F29A|nr:MULTISPECIES: DUF3306 domain-containing protein [unclassified Variovorax]MDM0120446.1 DUF3306 domain-containing protein [Variovorax sp. J2L1-78]MDM0127642.1 DUF3306 domain-containing protein [Variovorax sp. J2L1-63]MDM0231341.1 DUF3306 domain-containing protein [Variovorax sp. J2R1-6]